MKVKLCPKCDSEYLDGRERCALDGEALVECDRELPAALVDATRALSEEPDDASPEDTENLAREIKDLIFKVCSECHLAYSGGLDVCPRDGSRLVEQSLLDRETMVAETHGVTGSLKKYCPECNRSYPLHVESCEPCGGALAVPTLGGNSICGRERPWLDAVIDGKYRLIEKIGSGGFGNVYLAKHVSLGKRYAVKVLKLSLADATSFRDRFHEEALKLSRLEDENIVRVFDFGEWEDGQYMVAEYVEGEDLGAVIYRETVPELRAARIMRQVAGALAEAHAKKIIHLDLKPANVLVARRRGEDAIKVIDFGIAELYSASLPKRQESVTGTCSYMAPEQWRKEPLDPRTDVYSFGVIFYELLAGRQLFRRETVSEFRKAHCDEAPAPLRKLRPDLSPELEKIVHRCLEKRRERRFQSAAEVEAALDAYVRRAENLLGRWLLRAGVAVAVLASLAGGGWGVWEMARDRRPPEWVSFRVEGEGLRETARAGARKAYETRETKVVLVFEARDDRKVGALTVLSTALPEGSKTFPGDGEARVALDLVDLGPTTVTARAVDAAGNRTEDALVVVRHVSARVDVDTAKIPEYTNENPLRLFFTKLEGVNARVACRRATDPRGAEPRLLVEVERGTDGAIPSVEVFLESGKNVLTLSATDLLTGNTVLNEQELGTVDFRDDRLEVSAAVTTVDGSVIALEDGRWLSSREEVEVRVEVEQARRRLWSGVEIRFEGVVVLPPGSAWSDEELERGHALRTVRLGAGTNRIVIDSIEDRYGNTSEEVALTVELDRDPPEVEVLRDEVEYYGDELPAVDFTVVDDHSFGGTDGVVLLGGNGLPVDAGYEVVPRSDGLRLRFTEEAVLARDGRHRFRIVARDRVGNASGPGVGEFAVLADHDAPEIEVARPAAGHQLRRGDPSLALALRVRDAFPDTLDVEVTFRGFDGAPGPAFPLMRTSPDPVGDQWEVLVPAGPGGIEKPAEFGSLDTGFVATFHARDAAGQETTAELPLAFAWENGDRLRWRDGSVLVYHEACPGRVAPFFIAETEVSNRQYARFVDESGITPPASPDWEGGSCRPDRLDFPLRRVSWREARAYSEWAGLDLPSRELWLVAAFWDYSTAQEREYPWSDRKPGADWRPIRAGRELRAPVAVSGAEEAFAQGRTPDPHRVAHLFGNVWEMALDSKTGEVHRLGGGFDTAAPYFELERFRGYLLGEPPDGHSISPDHRSYDLGFRCMLLTEGGAR